MNAARIFCVLLAAPLSFLILLPSLLAQQADTPVYKEGDWWRVRVGTKRPGGVSVAGPQLGGFPEYLVRMEEGRFKVFGVREGHHKEIDSATLVSIVLGQPGWRGDLLKFPMRGGLSWSAHFSLEMPGVTRQEQAQYEVQTSEKVKTPKGEFEAFKIVMTVPERTGRAGRLPGRAIIYYYAPQVKAIVDLREEPLPKTQEALTTSTLVDFHVSP